MDRTSGQSQVQLSLLRIGGNCGNLRTSPFKDDLSDNTTFFIGVYLNEQYFWTKAKPLTFNLLVNETFLTITDDNYRLKKGKRAAEIFLVTDIPDSGLDVTSCLRILSR